MAKSKHKLPAPIYSTDVYLAAVLQELEALNETMQKLLQPRIHVTKPETKKPGTK